MPDFGTCITGLPTIGDDAYCQGFSGCGNPIGMQPTAVNLNGVLRRIQQAGDNGALGLDINGGNLILTQNGTPIDTVALPVGSGSLWQPGDIKMQYGAAPIEAGWAVCDGSLGTPDLRDRFIVGSGGAYLQGATGGSATHIHVADALPHVLTISEMPSHNHGNGVTDNLSQVFNHGSVSATPQTANSVETGSSNGILEGLTDLQGGGQGHSHEVDIDPASSLPPFYALRFVMKLP